MTKKYAKVTIEYTDYLIDISDAQSLLNILSNAERVALRKDEHQDKYIPMRDGNKAWEPLTWENTAKEKEVA